MDRIQRYVSVPMLELRVDDNQIVNVVQILPDAFCSDAGIDVVNGNVSRGP